MIFIFSCIFFLRLWRTFLRNTLYISCSWDSSFLLCWMNVLNIWFQLRSFSPQVSHFPLSVKRRNKNVAHTILEPWFAHEIRAIEIEATLTNQIKRAKSRINPFSHYLITGGVTMLIWCICLNRKETANRARLDWKSTVLFVLFRCVHASLQEGPSVRP